jgi:hypothetical protein
MSRCPVTKSVDRHFAGSISAAEERAMREHLPGCSECLARYNRQLVLSELDPHHLEPEERIGHGLGLGRSRVKTYVAAGVGALAVAATVFLFVHGLPRAGERDRFAARGEVNVPPASQVLVYEVRPGEEPKLAGETLRADDELAFAYENGAAKGRLMIFGVDEHQHVYWFFPAWTSEADSPTAIPIAQDAARHSLPEAVRQKLDGNKLQIRAIFLDEVLSVRDVEQLVHDHPDAPLPVAGAVESSTSFAVRP